MFKVFSVILVGLLMAKISFASQPHQWQMLLQDPASPVMQAITPFHSFLLQVCAAIVLVVFGLLAYVCVRFSAKNNPVPATFTHNILIEVIWTVIPILIIVAISIPSFKILKMQEEIPTSELTVKVIGYQWYWHYEYPEYGVNFDSYMLTDDKLSSTQKRLLEVDNRLVLPADTNVKFLITAGDVIHSFAVPSLGLKTDAIPGRINETWTKILKKDVVLYGQCSELCGVNHGFMPIAIEVVSKEDFQKWLEKAKSKYSIINTKIAKGKM